MSRVSVYRWNLVNDAYDLTGENFHCLSDDFLAADFNLQEAALIRPFDTRISIPIIKTGKVQGVITWLVIHVAENVIVSNSPFIDPMQRSTYRKPVFQYCDPMALDEGSSMNLTIHFNLTKLWFETVPRSSILRSHLIPSWYFPMLHDGERNKRYKEAITWLVNDWVEKNPR